MKFLLLFLALSFSLVNIYSYDPQIVYKNLSPIIKKNCRVFKSEECALAEKDIQRFITKLNRIEKQEKVELYAKYLLEEAKKSDLIPSFYFLVAENFVLFRNIDNKNIHAIVKSTYRLNSEIAHEERDRSEKSNAYNNSDFIEERFDSLYKSMKQ